MVREAVLPTQDGDVSEGPLPGDEEDIKTKVTVTGRLENILEENISVATVQMITKITEVRKLKLDK